MWHHGKKNVTDIHTDTEEINLNSIFIGYISPAINMYGRADFIYRKLSQIQKSKSCTETVGLDISDRKAEI